MKISTKSEKPSLIAAYFTIILVYSTFLYHRMIGLAVIDIIMTLSLSSMFTLFDSGLITYVS
jgi:hypothetical protein